MNIPFSPRRAAENELIFREKNEHASEILDKLQKIAESEGRPNLVKDDDPKLHFYCECSDENCDKRIILKTSKYRDLRKNNDCFVISPGHQVNKIERVISVTKNYMVVEKFNTPPDAPDNLNLTPVNNV